MAYPDIRRLQLLAYYRSTYLPLPLSQCGHTVLFSAISRYLYDLHYRGGHLATFY